MQMGFYFDQTRCTGCYACVVACKDWHDVPAGPASWRKVATIEEGNFPDLFVAFLGWIIFKYLTDFKIVLEDNKYYLVQKCKKRICY